MISKDSIQMSEVFRNKIYEEFQIIYKKGGDFDTVGFKIRKKEIVTFYSISFSHEFLIKALKLSPSNFEYEEVDEGYSSDHKYLAKFNTLDDLINFYNLKEKIKYENIK